MNWHLKYPRFPVKFVPAFDESFNQVSTTKQMDVYIIYFDETTNRVKRVYLNSRFMGVHYCVWYDGRFQESTQGLDLINNLVQLSMDGPNVFLEELDKYRKLENLFNYAW